MINCTSNLFKNCWSVYLIAKIKLLLLAYFLAYLTQNKNKSIIVHKPNYGNCRSIQPIYSFLWLSNEIYNLNKLHLNDDNDLDNLHSDIGLLWKLHNKGYANDTLNKYIFNSSSKWVKRWSCCFKLSDLRIFCNHLHSSLYRPPVLSHFQVVVDFIALN